IFCGIFFLSRLNGYFIMNFVSSHQIFSVAMQQSPLGSILFSSWALFQCMLLESVVYCTISGSQTGMTPFVVPSDYIYTCFKFPINVR
ncbi:MAG: hypothetical protein O7157_03655, partial [Wolbachia endosymbiont of Tetragnatha montana]|nr:hypothetical protein [Wolbachia endosymbiont of Tetragnatha montana]